MGQAEDKSEPGASTKTKVIEQRKKVENLKIPLEGMARCANSARHAELSKTKAMEQGNNPQVLCEVEVITGAAGGRGRPFPIEPRRYDSQNKVITNLVARRNRCGRDMLLMRGFCENCC